MPQRRARFCSATAAVASLPISSRSQGPLPLSVIFEPHEIDLPAALLEPELHQPLADAWTAHAAPALGIVGGTVGGAQQIAAVEIEKYSFLPVEFHRHVRAAIQIPMRGSPI